MSNATVTINQAAGQADPSSNSVINFELVFSEPVDLVNFSNFFSFAGSTASVIFQQLVFGDHVHMPMTVKAVTEGTVVVSIPANAFRSQADASFNQASTSTDNTVTVDVAPTVTIDQAAGQTDPTNGSPILYTVVFSESVTGFDASDISFAGSTAGGTLVAGVSGSGANYTVSVTGMTGVGAVVASIPAGAALDAGAIPNTASTSTDNTVNFDAVAPTVTIDQAAGQTDPTNGSPILYTVVFSESVIGFDASDISLAGSTVGGTLVAGVTGSGANYTVTVTGMTGSGSVVASIPAGAALDASTNPNTASTSTDNTVAFDNVAPTVTIDQAAGQTDPTNGSPILYTVVFSESVTGFTASDISFAGSTAGGTLVAGVSGSGANYTVTVTGMTGIGSVVASIPAGAALDAATNPNTASTSTDNTVNFDAVAPTVTIDQAAGQTDPTNGSPILYTVVFSESVTGFTASDVSFAGSTVGGTLVAGVSGSGANYTVTVTGMTGSGSVVASIPAGAALDASTNPNTASTSTDNTVAFDNVAPTVTIDQAAGQTDPTNGSPILYTVVFSESVTGFTASDISLAGSTAGGTLVAGVTGSGANYTVTVTGMTGNGSVVASIVAGAALDAATNPSTSSTSTDNTVTFDTTAPTVTINQAAGQTDPALDGPILYTVVFSEAVTGFTGSDISFAGSTVGGTPVATVSGSGANYTVSVIGMTGNGSVVAAIPAGAALDAANNANTASTSTDNTVSYSSSNDSLVASDSGPQTLSGLGGDDTLLGSGSGNYALDGGTGNDLLNASGSGGETLTRGLGNDTLVSFGSGIVAMDGGDGDDSLQANGVGAEALAGGNGNDTLLELASVGNHSLDGGNGNDLLNYSGSGTNNDVLTGGLGNDTLVAFGNGSVAMDGGDGDDSLQANGAGAETLSGGNGNDTQNVEQLTFADGTQTNPPGFPTI